MRALPDARLLLMAPAGQHRRRLLQRLEAQHIAAQRVSFVDRSRLERSALMDGARFAANIEDAYRRAWSAYCGLAAAP